MRIFCIIPAFNEANNIEKTLSSLEGIVDKIVVVDDCSSDDTYAIAKKRGIVVLRHSINRGQGAALQTGNEYALRKGADIAVHFDADGQFLANEIGDIVKPIIVEDFDIVFGSRFMEKKSNMPIFKKLIIMNIARFINRVFWGIKLSDPQNGFRAMNRKTMQKININNDGSAHCSEILSKAVKCKLKFKEVPVTVEYNNFGQGIFSGKGRGMGGARIIKDLILGKLLK